MLPPPPPPPPPPVPTAAQTAAAVRAGRLRALAAVEQALARIAAYDNEIRAFTVVRAEAARAEAAALDAGGPGHDGPLAGVPVAVKEEYHVAGEVTTLGGRGNSTPAERDSAVVARLRAAGAIVVGKTAMPEFGQFPHSTSEVHGHTHNPWDLSRSPGGSSSGSAAAVAAGLVPIAMGADGGGSVRVPAAWCGLVGLKPQRGRISPAPLREHWFGLVSLGALTRTVTDQALVLDVVSGNEPGDRWRFPSAGMPFADQVAAATQSTRGLRIAWTTRGVIPGPMGGGVDPQVAQAVAATAAELADLGHRVHRIEAPWPVPTAAFLPLFYAGMREEAGQVEHPQRLEARTRHTVGLAGWTVGPTVRLAQREGRRVAASLDRAWAHWDAVLLPTVPVLPRAVADLDGLGTLRAQLRSTAVVGNTAIFNVTGHPALSVPAGLSREGWPIGAQFVGPAGSEGRLLALAAQLETARPWPHVAPRYR